MPAITKRLAAALAGSAMLIAAGAAAPAGADEKADNVKTEIEQAWDAISGYSADQKDKAVKEGEELLDRLDKEIAELRTDANDAGGEANDEAKKRLTELEELRDKAGERLERLRQAGSERWDDVKAAFGDAVAAFQERYERNVGE